MAKKNSTKTATEKSIQASEPRVQVFTGWQGINIKDAPLGWQPLEHGHHDRRQTDLKPNYLMLQNNMVTEDSMTIQTRPDAIKIANKPVIEGLNPDNIKFTGVSYVYDHWIFLVCRIAHIKDIQHPEDKSFIERIYWAPIPRTGIISNSNWKVLKLYDAETDSSDHEPIGYEICEIGVFEKTFIATVKHKIDDDDKNQYEGEIFTASFVERFTTTETYENGITRTPKSITIDGNNGRVRSAQKIQDPTTGATLTAKGMNSGSGPSQQMTSRTEISYVYTNRFGSTIARNEASIYTEYDPVTWSSERYLVIEGPVTPGQGITGVDVYASTDDKQTKAFVAHVDIKSTDTTWKTKWLGAMSDISDWANSSLSMPEENTTKGAPATYFEIHDSRLYFWGNPSEPYRLYIGGNPGNELSIARGVGGAFIDIEPGSGIEVMGTAKWKTVSGANIITMMCGNPNTNMVKRFNLVETNLVTTNEVSSKGYMYEEVSNVVGCNSRWGYGVYDDGLYSISRYGLMLTTMAMEYNSQMRSQQVSDVIQPVFTDRMGNLLKNCRMVCIDSVIYIALHEPNSVDDTSLDQVILVYDIGLKSWYTFTHDQVVLANDPDEKIRHIMPIDADDRVEGLGVISDNEVWLYPTAGFKQEQEPPDFNILVETGELAVRQPVQQFHYLHQIELRFDYFIGSGIVVVEGIDYYGRPFTVTKLLNKKGSSSNMREYVEWIQVSKLVESYRIRILGKMRCRLVSMNAKLYTHANRIGTSYGYDDSISYRNRHGEDSYDHHYITDYNNLKLAIVT